MNREHVIGGRLKRGASCTIGLLILVTSAFGQGRETASFYSRPIPDQRSWFQRTFKRIGMEDAMAASRSPRDICDIASRNISYRADFGDHWASAEETWLRGKGDCEDFAVVVQELCGRLGVEVSIYLFFPAGRREAGHAVAVGQWDGRYWVSSNGSYAEADSFEGIRRLVAREMRWNPDELWHSVLGAGDAQRFIARDRSSTDFSS